MSYTFELNNERRDANFVSGKVNGKSAVVEIFSAMTNGKDLAPYGKKADVAAKYIMDLNSKASAGDLSAVSELNEIRRFAMQPVLMKEIKLLGIYGNYRAIGYNESCEVEIPDFANVSAEIQAPGQDVKLPTIRKKRVSIATTTISGDYALISQFNGFAGYEGKTPTVNGISQAVMDEIHNTGLMGLYNGAVLSEIPNPYDLTSINKDGDNFDTMLPAGLGYVIPSGGQSPIYTVTRGGLTSFSGNDVSTGQIISRFDLEVGALVAPGREYEVGIIADKNLGIPE